MIYIEYISRRPGADLAAFHQAAAKGQEGWASNYQEDQLLLNVGRTWRLGPEPEYMAVWHSPGTGFERLDAWDCVFRSGAADHLEEPFHQVARIEAAGCYQPLLEPVPARQGTYYAEFFRARRAPDAIRALYQQRQDHHSRFCLNLLACRIGRLGPEPGGLAVWTLPNFAALAQIAGELDDMEQPLEPVMAGLYADLGSEIL